MSEPNEETAPEKCPRCGRIDCDKIPPGVMEKTIEFFKNAPRIYRDYDEPPEPF